MQRIEAGRFRGRRLLALPDGVDGLRPMAARVRAAVFDRLQTRIADLDVLDLFAGSGALGFEALSRGAAHVTFVERHEIVAKRLRAQARVLGVEARIEVHTQAVERWLAGAARTRRAYDLVFVDPPFAAPEQAAAALVGLQKGRWLRPQALIVCERERVRGQPAVLVAPEGLAHESQRTYGQVVLDFFVHVDKDGAENEP